MKKKSFSAREAAVISAAAVIIAVSITSMVFFSSNPVEMKEVRMHLKVANYTGFNLDTDALYFGAIAPGGTGERALAISNQYDTERKVRILLSGELSHMVFPEEAEFIIPGKSDKSVMFRVLVPEEAKEGEYEGTITIMFSIP